MTRWDYLVEFIRTHEWQLLLCVLALVIVYGKWF